MICVTIGRTRHKSTIAEHQQLAELGVQLVELRLDYIGRSVDLKRIVAQRPTPAVVTCRRREDGGRWQKSEVDRQMLLRAAIADGVDYVDLEWDIADKIPRYGRTKRIVSLHNFDQTPSDLEAIHRRLANLDADIVKIATMANSFRDTMAMLRLLEQTKTPTIGICMGELGIPTRVLAHRFGSPFTFATFSTSRQVAPGQLTLAQMRDLYRVESITPKTKLYGLVADPIAHSYSPLIHNQGFLAQGLDARYIPFRVPPTELPIFLDWCRSFGVQGLSVTIPHKEAMLGLIDHVDPAAQQLGAINTVIFRGEQTYGYNTDYEAAMQALDRAMAKVSPERRSEDYYRGRAALVLGAGGVARTVAIGLRERGAVVAISSRNLPRSEELAQAIGGRALPWSGRHDIRPGIIVNGTPIGMHPELDSCPYDTDKLSEGTVVFDTVYNPDPTLLIKRARARGATTVRGLEMFLGQAGQQYQLFTGQAPPLAAMQAALKRAISPINYQGERPDEETSESSEKPD